MIQSEGRLGGSRWHVKHIEPRWHVHIEQSHAKHIGQSPRGDELVHVHPAATSWYTCIAKKSVALRAEANRMRREGKITVSMISIVDRSTDPQFQLEAELLTRDGGGQYLPIEDPAAVPVLVSAEVTRALSRVGRKPRRPGDGNQPPTDTKPIEPPVEPPPEQQTPPPVEPRRLPVRAVAESALLAPDPEVWPSLGEAVATEAPFEARVLLGVEHQFTLLAVSYTTTSQRRSGPRKRSLRA